MYLKCVFVLFCTCFVATDILFAGQKQKLVLQPQYIRTSFSRQQKIAAGLVAFALFSAMGYKVYNWYLKSYPNIDIPQKVVAPPLIDQKKLEAFLFGKLPIEARLDHPPYNKPYNKWPEPSKENQNVIFFYKKGEPYYQFTNFYNVPITIDTGIEGIDPTWKTSEHYYQGQKYTKAPSFMMCIQKDCTPRDAFTFAQINKEPVDDDWKKRNLSVMYKALAAKFSQYEDLRELLLKTGGAVLIEDAGKNDSFFGAGEDYTGENYLGRLLMMIRDDIKEFEKQHIE